MTNIKDLVWTVSKYQMWSWMKLHQLFPLEQVAARLSWVNFSVTFPPITMSWEHKQPITVTILKVRVKPLFVWSLQTFSCQRLCFIQDCSYTQWPQLLLDEALCLYLAFLLTDNIQLLFIIFLKNLSLCFSLMSIVFFLEALIFTTRGTEKNKHTFLIHLKILLYQATLEKPISRTQLPNKPMVNTLFIQTEGCYICVWRPWNCIVLGALFITLITGEYRALKKD